MILSEILDVYPGESGEEPFPLMFGSDGREYQTEGRHLKAAAVSPSSSRTPDRLETSVTSTIPPFMGVAIPPGKDLGQEGAMLVAFQQIMATLKLRHAAQTAELAELRKAVVGIGMQQAQANQQRFPLIDLTRPVRISQYQCFQSQWELTIMVNNLTLDVGMEW
jgi:hypothetical protein